MPFFIQQLKERGYLETVQFIICIVGSRKIRSDDDYGSGVWNFLAPNLTIYGFDADEEACAINNAELESRGINWTEKHIPLALSNEAGESTLYVTQGVDCSSLYPPNEPYLNRLAVLDEHIKLDFEVELETITLDQFCQQENIDEIDFLHLDIQGAELKVLEGATELMTRSLLGIQSEVEFSPLYRNQPLFSDLDSYLRCQGFSLFDLMTDHPFCRCRRSISPIYSSRRIGQLLWADALYFRDPMLENAHPITQHPQQIFKLACIADILDYPDYALELLSGLTVKHGENSQYNFTALIQDCLKGK